MYSRYTSRKMGILSMYVGGMGTEIDGRCADDGASKTRMMLEDRLLAEHTNQTMAVQSGLG